MTNGSNSGGLEEVVQRLSRMQEVHTTILSQQQNILNQQAEILANHNVLIGRLNEQLEETRRDARHTQRLWTRLAQKYGWLDDDDLSQP